MDLLFLLFFKLFLDAFAREFKMTVVDLLGQLGLPFDQRVDDLPVLPELFLKPLVHRK